MMCRRIGAAVLAITLTMIFAESPVMAQSSDVARGNAGSRPSTQSPEVAADRRVTFRLRAEKAGEVLVAGQWGGEPLAMTKGEGDVWSVAVGPIEPGVWSTASAWTACR